MWVLVVIVFVRWVLCINVFNVCSTSRRGGDEVAVFFFCCLLWGCGVEGEG